MYFFGALFFVFLVVFGWFVSPWGLVGPARASVGRNLAGPTEWEGETAPFFNFSGFFSGTLPEKKPEKLKKGASIKAKILLRRLEF